MEKIERILVVSRTTKYCQKAVHYGILLTKKHGAKLYVLHSIHNPFGLEGWNVPLPSIPALHEEYKRMQEEAKSDLDKILDKEKAAGLPIEVIISNGEPNEDIFRVVKEKNIDLLIVRAHEEGRIEHFLFGRSNEEIVRKLPCSIMLIKDEPKAVP